MKELLGNITRLVKEELIRANEKNPMFHSDHEAFAVIDEEVWEVMQEFELMSAGCKNFRDATYRDRSTELKGNAVAMIKNAAVRCACEAVQVAAMCDKWVQSNEKNKD